MMRPTRILALALSAVLFLQAIVAQGLPDGKYIITLFGSDGSPIYLGVKPSGGPTDPVLFTSGSRDIWDISHGDGQGNYVISNEDRTRFVENNGGELVLTTESSPAYWRLVHVEGGPDNALLVELSSNNYPAEFWGAFTSIDDSVKLSSTAGKWQFALLQR